MHRKSSTCTGTLLLAGLSTLAANSSTNESINDDFCIPQENLYAIEVRYNAPENMESRIDNYVNFQYGKNYVSSSRYNTLEHNFMNVVQEFASQQKELDNDFQQTLAELFISKANQKPSKNRFGDD